MSVENRTNEASIEVSGSNAVIAGYQEDGLENLNHIRTFDDLIKDLELQFDDHGVANKQPQGFENGTINIQFIRNQKFPDGFITWNGKDTPLNALKIKFGPDGIVNTGEGPYINAHTPKPKVAPEKHQEYLQLIRKTVLEWNK